MQVAENNAHQTDLWKPSLTQFSPKLISSVNFVTTCLKTQTSLLFEQPQMHPQSLLILSLNQDSFSQHMTQYGKECNEKLTCRQLNLLNRIKSTKSKTKRLS